MFQNKKQKQERQKVGFFWHAVTLGCLKLFFPIVQSPAGPRSFLVHLNSGAAFGVAVFFLHSVKPSSSLIQHPDQGHQKRKQEDSEGQLGQQSARQQASWRAGWYCQLWLGVNWGWGEAGASGTACHPQGRV